METTMNYLPNVEVLGDEVDHKNYNGNLLHLASPLSEGSLFLGAGRGGGLGGLHLKGQLGWKKALQAIKLLELNLGHNTN